MRLGRRTRLTALFLVTCAAIALTEDPYEPSSPLEGDLRFVGSDTLINLGTLWAEGFKKHHPKLGIHVEGKGSSTAPPFLAMQKGNIVAPMARPMNSEEIEMFVKERGYAPTCLRVAIDGLAVIVNQENPIELLSLEVLDAIFSNSRKGGHHEDILTWGQLGLTGEWTDAPITLYGRHSGSVNGALFREKALLRGDFKGTVKEQPGSAAVVQCVTEDKFGIGYCGIGYESSGVRAIPIAQSAIAAALLPTCENCISDRYPLSRFLLLYVDKHPETGVRPVVAEFLRYVLSKDGQKIVRMDGRFPLSPELVREEREKLSRED